MEPTLNKVPGVDVSSSKVTLEISDADGSLQETGTDIEALLIGTYISDGQRVTVGGVVSTV